MATAKEYDLVVFGASGYTGQYVVEHIVTTAQKQEKIKFAVAGRSGAKLSQTLEKVSQYTGIDIRRTPRLIADVDDVGSLNNMARSARVVVNCVGPYKLYGEQVVKACVKNKAHHVDISGEPSYLESMVVKYHEEAKQNGVYIVGACGFDSIPNDMGIAYLLKHFKGDVNSIESYIDFQIKAPMFKRINVGTWKSAIQAFTTDLSPIRSKIFKEKLPKSSYPLKSRGIVHRNPIQDVFCLPFMGPDQDIVRRSQYYRYTEEKKRPVQTKIYFNSGSLLRTIFTILFGIYLAIMTKFEFTRKFLEKFPTLASFGLISSDGPDRKYFPKTSFTVNLLAKGWDTKISDIEQQHVSKPNKKMRVEVGGGEPGYIVTSMCLVQSAIVLIKDNKLLPDTGGVYTTAAAFTDTSLLDRLHKNGLEFSIIED